MGTYPFHDLIEEALEIVPRLEDFKNTDYGAGCEVV